VLIPSCVNTLFLYFYIAFVWLCRLAVCQLLLSVCSEPSGWEEGGGGGGWLHGEIIPLNQGLSHRFEESSGFSPKLQDKSGTEKHGFEASESNYA